MDDVFVRLLSVKPDAENRKIKVSKPEAIMFMSEEYNEAAFKNFVAQNVAAPSGQSCVS